MDSLFLVFIVVVVVFILVIFSNNYIVVKRYDYTSKKIPDEFDNIKIVHISDLHSKKFGKNNERLVKKIKKVDPDYIFMTGDIVDKRVGNIKEFLKDFECIFKNYPVYYSIGNHEKALGHDRYKEYIAELKKYGVHVLSDDSMYLDKEEKINIVGLDFKDNIRYEKGYKRIDKDLTYMRNKGGQLDLNKLNILLAHDSLNFELYKILGYDLIFSGHIHGGVIRFFNIGLLSPRRKLFPKYAVGKYQEGDSTMFVSTGLGKASVPIRIGNNPEISVIRFKVKR